MLCVVACLGMLGLVCYYNPNIHAYDDWITSSNEYDYEGHTLKQTVQLLYIIYTVGMCVYIVGSYSWATLFESQS